MTQKKFGNTALIGIIVPAPQNYSGNWHLASFVNAKKKKHKDLISKLKTCPLKYRAVSNPSQYQ